MTRQQDLHPVLDCAHRIEAALKDVVDLSPTFMTTQEKSSAHVALARVSAQLESLRLRLTAVSSDVAEESADRDVAAWLGRKTRVDRQAARRHQRLATALDRRWEQLGTALAQGRLNVDQAHVAARSLDDLADALGELGPLAAERASDILAEAEAHLIEKAADFGPEELRIIGRKILEVVAPDIAEEAERRRLEDDERRARRLTTLTTRRLGDGTTLIKARVPDGAAQRLATYLQAFTNPRKEDGAPTAEGGTKVRHEVRLGRAFCSLLEAIDPQRLPLHGGSATTLVLTMDVRDLVAGLGSATLPTGEAVSAGEARRLACSADLVPAVLGTGSHVLDLGLTARLFSAAQRRALALRDRHCRAEGCDIPADWCEAHHLTPWSRGGPTDLANGILLCSHHHHRIHDDRYLHDRLANGDVRFTRRR